MTTKSVFPKLDALEAAARGKGRLAVAVAYPCSTDALAAAISAYEEGIIEPVLVGTAPADRSLRQRAQDKPQWISDRRGGG